VHQIVTTNNVVSLSSPQGLSFNLAIKKIYLGSVWIDLFGVYVGLSTNISFFKSV